MARLHQPTPDTSSTRRQQNDGTAASRAARTLAAVPVNVRITISALWTSMLFIFAYVDLFSLYRPDFRADIAAGEISGFAITETFLLATTLYVVIPSLMIVLTLVARPQMARWTNLTLGPLYALSIIGAAIGEWQYYLLGSAVEIVLLTAIAASAWKWPTEPLG